MKYIYIGQCDQLRKTDYGEAMWQEMMSNKMEIALDVFRSVVDGSIILDDGESFEQFIAGDPDAYFARSYIGIDPYGSKILFIHTKGYEFIWMAEPLLEWRKWREEVMKEQNYYEIFAGKLLSERPLYSLYKSGMTPVEALNNLSTVTIL